MPFFYLYAIILVIMKRFIFLITGLSLFLTSCAATFLKVENQSDISIDKNEKILLCATSHNRDFAIKVQNEIAACLKKKNIDSVIFEEIDMPLLEFEKTKYEKYCLENGIRYAMFLKGISCSSQTGYMPPSTKLETYSYYVNGKLQTGSRTVSVPGYYYQYLTASFSVEFADVFSGESIFTARANTTGSNSASEKTLSRSFASKITKKLIKK